MVKLIGKLLKSLFLRGTPGDAEYIARAVFDIDETEKALALSFGDADPINEKAKLITQIILAEEPDVEQAAITSVDDDTAMQKMIQRVESIMKNDPDLQTLSKKILESRQP